jgi:hypothetical protein
MMQRLWSQVARPQLSCSCIACSSSVTGVLARRTASATTRRRLKLVDAFTILLGPVFATAFVADANWKDRRRIEWDRKIAEVEGEVERLHHLESQILRCLNSGVNARRKRIHHTRSYSTDVRSRILDDDTNEDVDAPQWRSMEPEVEEVDVAHQAPARDVHKSYTLHPQSTEDTKDAVRRIERLVALKFAIRMLLHVKVGTSPRFKDVNPGYAHDSSNNAEDLNGIMYQLKIIRRSLHKLNSAEERPDVSTFQKLPRIEQAVVDQEIRHHAHDFQLGNLSVSRLVKRIGNSIMRSPEPPSVKAYVPLMTAFSRARLDELAYLVMAAMDEGRLTLSNHSLFNIIWQYGKNRDANRFDLFLNSVTKADTASKYTESWKWRTINEIQLPCPMSNNSRLLQILVYTALKCNQPHRAEAWASQLRYSDGPARHTSHVLRNFMKFYATHRDWQRGQAWLSAALDWSVSLGPNVIRDLQRVVFAMLELCVACGKQDAYTCILQAAVHARVGVFAAEADLKFTERSKSIIAEWDKLQNSVPMCAENDESTAQNKARDFCDEVTPKLESLGLTGISPRFEWPTPVSADFEFRDGRPKFSASTDDSTSEWRKLCEQQAAELEKVKAQLAETKWLLSRNARSDIEEFDSQASANLLNSAQLSEAPLCPATVNSVPNSLAEHSVPSSEEEERLPPSSNIALSVSPEVNQDTDTASSAVGPRNSDSEQKWAAIVAQVADPGMKTGKSSRLEDLVQATTSSHGHFKNNKEAELAITQKTSRHETATESIHEDSSPYTSKQIPPDSIQSNAMSEFRPFVAGPRNLAQETDDFQERYAYELKSDALESPIEKSFRPPALSPGVALPHLVGEANNEFSTRSSAPSTTSAADVLKNAADMQAVETSNQTKKGQWISFLKMPRSRQLSAHATLRYIHIQKPEPAKPVEQPQPGFVGDKDRKPPPFIMLRLSQLPPPKAFKFVDGEFKSRKWSPKKAEAYAVNMKARPEYNGRG